MYLHEVTMTSYVLLRAGWTVGQAQKLLQRVEASHVIVHRTEPDVDLWLDEHTPDEPLPAVQEEYYYLYTIQEVHALLRGQGEGVPLRYALNLHEYTATSTHDLYTDADDAPDRAVVLDEGRVVGFLDVTVPPMPLTQPKRRTDGLAGDTQEDEAMARSLQAEFPEQVAMDSTVSLLVSLSVEVQLGGAAPRALPIVAAAGTVIDIVVQPKRGLQLEGPAEGQLVVTDDEETLPLQFRLRAVALGRGQVRVLAFQSGQSLGAITLAPTVVEAVNRHEQAIVEQGVQFSAASEPDLNLLIFEGYQDGKPTLTFRLKALDADLGLNFAPFGPVSLRNDPLEYINTLFEDIESLPLRTPEDRAIAESKLIAKGATLFQQLIPPDLQRLLWSLRDSIQCVQVQSEEPWIPWEICRLQGEENGRIVGGPFFCEAFAMTRWLMGMGVKPRLSLNKMGLVIPSDSQLPYARHERDYMLSLANGDRQVTRIPATFLDLKGALAQGVYDGWHFTGHGGFRAPDPNRSILQLQSGNRLMPEDLSDEARNLGMARPLVFLNACQIGRSGMSLTDIGGWAAQFLRAGAGAFVGALWSVYDRPAYNFVQHFYGNLLGGMPIGEAARQARLAIKADADGDPTWLAYTVYAHPLATVQP